VIKIDDTGTVDRYLVEAWQCLDQSVINCTIREWCFQL